MNRLERGSINLMLLGFCTFFSVVTIVAAYYLTTTYQKQVQALEQLQLRTLAGSAMQALATEEQPADEESLGSVTLYPGPKTATLSSRYTSSTDDMLHALQVTAATDQQQATFQKLYFTPSSDLQALAQQYALVATYGLSGSSYLASSTPYTSKGTVSVPQVSFLADYTASDLDTTALRQAGGNQAFLYLTSQTGTTALPRSNSPKPTSSLTIKGSMLIASHNNLLVANRSIFPDRLILITDRGTITIGDNVTLQSALIISKGALTIGKNCHLNGLFLAQDRIVLKGSSTITKDATVVAPFASSITSVLP